MSFFDDCYSTVKRAATSTFANVVVLVGKCAATAGQAYFATAEAFQSKPLQLHKGSARPFAIISAVCSFLIMVASRAKSLFKKSDEDNGDELSNCIAYPFLACIFISTGFATLGGWFGVASFGDSEVLSYLGLIPSVCYLRVFFSFNQREAQANLAEMLAVFSGRKDLNRKAFVKTLLTSVSGNLAKSAFVFFITKNALLRLGFEEGSSVILPLSFFNAGTLFITNMLARSYKVYDYFNPGPEKFPAYQPLNACVRAILSLPSIVDAGFSFIGYIQAGVIMLDDIGLANEYVRAVIAVITGASAVWNDTTFALIPGYKDTVRFFSPKQLTRQDLLELGPSETTPLLTNGAAA